MAPEQIRGERPSPAVDVFAWGATIGYGANGYPPFRGGYPPAIINRILHSEPDLGRLEGPLRELVAACLHKNPNRRPTAQQLLVALSEENAGPVAPPSMTQYDRRGPWRLDVTKPNVARVYDYLLEGKNNFAADRMVGERLLTAVPGTRESVRANRGFLQRAVRAAAAMGIRQFLDIGSGLPTADNTHETAQRATPDARVVYVDSDPLVRAHGQALLATTQSTVVVEADLHQPEVIMNHPDMRKLIDFDQPAALLLLGILHLVLDDGAAHGILKRLAAPLASGSLLAISHLTADCDPQGMARFCRVLQEAPGAQQAITRTREQVHQFFDGFDILDPGVVAVDQWRPEHPVAEGHFWLWSAVGHKN